MGGNQSPISFAKNCIPMQTFLDIQMSVHFVVLLVIQFRENFPALPVPLHLTGSDSCEQFFSKVGGMKGHERSYDLAELVECATNLNRLGAMEVSQGLVGAGKSHKKHSMIWMTKLHPLQEGVLAPSQADYTRIVTDAEVVVALKEGFVLAQNSATECQMNPSTSASNTVWWKKPWEIERKGVRFGGWCDVNVETLTDLTDTLEPETTPIQSTVETSIISTVVIEPLATAEEDSLSDDASEVALAGADVRVAMDDMYADLVYGVEKPNVRPTVCMEGRVVYKSTMVS